MLRMSAFWLIVILSLFGAICIQSGQRAATPAIAESLAIRYVSNDGSDINDGYSWASAKRTIYGALVSLPGGSPNGPASGSGTVYVASGSAANPRANSGIWLMQPQDPNYASPPPGWLRCRGCSLDIIGIANSSGAPNAHTPRAVVLGGSGADNNHPAVWLAGNQGPIRFQNLTFNSDPGRGIVIGECSNHDRKGTCTSTTVTFENVSVGVNQTARTGPTVDITGYAYWIWFRDCGFSGNAYRAAAGRFANNAAAILMDGTGNNGESVYITDSNLAGGGIKVIPGTNGSNLQAKNVTEEGCCGDIPPVVWFTNWVYGNSAAVIENVQLADTGPTPTPDVQNDGTKGNGGPVVFNSGWVQGLPQ